MGVAELVAAAIDLLDRLPRCNWLSPETGRACLSPAYHRDLVGRGRYCREHADELGIEQLQPVPWAGAAERLQDLIAREHRLTPQARDVLLRAARPAAGGILLRVPDHGVWTTRDATLDARGVPDWTTSTDLVRRLTRNGYLSAKGDRLAELSAPKGWIVRVLTRRGRLLIRELAKLDRGGDG